MSGSPPLVELLVAPGPTVASSALQGIWSDLELAARDGGWLKRLNAARPAIAPIIAASPYLAGLCRRWPDRLDRALKTAPNARLAEILADTAGLTGGVADNAAPLRGLKADLHLLTALSDLGGVWSLDAVTGALSSFADACTGAALRAVAHDARERGRLIAPLDPANPIPGLFCLAMGKHGARELNYSSDIDISFFHEPSILAAALITREEPQAFADRAVGALARLLSERTGDGYVFRVDLRLRPDPASTPPVVAAPAALAYYETVGQNWERAAFIKARAVAGDFDQAQIFLRALAPFVWRRSLDFAAIADVHSIKRQIHVHRVEDVAETAGANLKLGRGGIREIEFFVQTQQLILGGRDASLRASRTVEALFALALAGHIKQEAASELAAAYARLRALEHRVQMLDDEQSHTLPEDRDRRAAVAALSGEDDLDVFDASVSALLARVNARYGELFPDDEQLSSVFGSLVFTGVENDPETLRTLDRMGFSSPNVVADTIRAWHHGRISATRSARGREVFTRLAPQLLDICAATGAPDAAFRRFARFFAQLRAGVQVQSLLLAQPALFALIVETMAFSPRLADTLSRQAAALDAIMDESFFAPIEDDSGVVGEIIDSAVQAPDFEAAMNAVRRLHREQAFRISLQILAGTADPRRAGEPFSDLAEACAGGLAQAAHTELRRIGGDMAGGVVVVALGKLGSREMSGASDLDLMTIYDAPDQAESDRRGWGADVWYGRYTQRLIAALSAPTAEGELYSVDMRLRPSGAAGPVAVSLAAFQAYYEQSADTWELMALTRARIIWSSDPGLADQIGARITAVLRLARDAGTIRRDAASMRRLMQDERPAWGFWDMKRSPGGLIDCEFAAQALQLSAASLEGPLRTGTAQALVALEQSGHLAPADAKVLIEAWELQQALAQMLRAALERRSDPAREPSRFQGRLARIAGVETLGDLEALLVRQREGVRRIFERLIGPIATDSPGSRV